MTKPAADWLRDLLPGARLFDVPLPGNAGVDRARLVEIGGARLIAKRLDLGNATLNRLATEAAERLFAELANAAPGTLVVPVAVHGQYTHRRDGAVLAFFPAIGDPHQLHRPRANPSARELRDNAIEVARELAAVSADTIAAFDAAGIRADVHRLVTAGYLASPAFQAVQSVADVTAVLDSLASTPRASRLSHGDYHPGNLLRDGAGRIRVIDLDQLTLASPAADLVKVLIWQNADETTFAEEWANLEACLGTSLGEAQAATAVAAFLLWADDNFGQPFRGRPMTPELFRTGITSAMAWYTKRWKPGW